MARITKARREADEFREKIVSLLAEQHGWHGYDYIRHWLTKLVRREQDYVYTEAERAAVARIISARTPFEGWAGYSVPELTKGALKYVADFGYDEELFLRDIEADHATRLVMDEMRTLVSLCIMAGMDIPRFSPRADGYNYDDA